MKKQTTIEGLLNGNVIAKNNPFLCSCSDKPMTLFCSSLNMSIPNIVISLNEEKDSRQLRLYDTREHQDLMTVANAFMVLNNNCRQCQFYPKTK